jgi:hypothetical protein
MRLDEGVRHSTGRPSAASDGSTERLTRGVCRLLLEMGYGALTEFRLTNGRRVDIIGLSPAGEFAIVEVKSSVEDFRSDHKWQEYLLFCDRFFFAVPDRFPHQILPENCGLIVADGFAATVRRPSPAHPFNRTRKRRQLVRFAMTASQRLRNLVDPTL